MKNFEIEKNRNFESEKIWGWRSKRDVLVLIFYRIFSNQKQKFRTCIQFIGVEYLVPNVNSRREKKDMDSVWPRIKEFYTYLAFRGRISWNHTTNTGIIKQWYKFLATCSLIWGGRSVSCTHSTVNKTNRPRNSSVHFYAENALE